jgi:signal transduction histidine kinase
VSEKVLAALDTISDESHRLATLATDTMDMFVKNAEKDNEKIIDIGKMVTQLANMLIPTADKQNISVVTDLPKHLPSVWGTVAELTRVVWNILENALRHTTEGTISVLGNLQTKQDIIYVSITIADTGCGMTNEIKSRAFERGYSSGEMTGLELTFCKKIIEAHSGEIYIESELGKGCAVTFILPEYIERKNANE